MDESIEKILEKIRPAFLRHKGNISLVHVDKDTGLVRVQLHGACQGCPLSALTMKAGVEAALKDALPWVKEVVAVGSEQ
jgi:Fe-S cluster biogenesis protein NfuA